MASEEALYQQHRDGLAASAELAVLGDAFTQLKAEYTKAWEETAARDTDARERLWQAVQIVAKVESHLLHLARGGEFARKQLEEIAGRKKRLGIV